MHSLWQQVQSRAKLLSVTAAFVPCYNHYVPFPAQKL